MGSYSNLSLNPPISLRGQAIPYYQRHTLATLVVCDKCFRHISIILVQLIQAYQPSRICRESHDFSCNLKVSQAAISISRFLAAVANSHRLCVQTYGFAPPSSRSFDHISQFQAHGCDLFFFFWSSLGSGCSSLKYTISRFFT